MQTNKSGSQDKKENFPNTQIPTRYVTIPVYWHILPEYPGLQLHWTWVDGRRLHEFSFWLQGHLTHLPPGPWLLDIFIHIIDVLLLGCCTRFPCHLIMWCSQLAKITIFSIHLLYPLLSPPRVSVRIKEFVEKKQKK